MNNNQKKQRVIEVSFTKISEDVIVPSWRAQTKEAESFKDNTFLWWGLGGFWLLLVFVSLKNRIGLEGVVFATGFILLLGSFFYFLGKIPQKWIELNRKDGFISVWTSRKKRKLVGRWHIHMVAIKMNRRWVASSPRSGENRYLIELFDNNPVMKNTSFWKYNNNPQRKGVPFFNLFDLFGDPHSFEEEADYALAWAITHNIDTFVHNFLSGQPIAPSSTSTYTFTVPE